MRAYALNLVGAWFLLPETREVRDDADVATVDGLAIVRTSGHLVRLFSIYGVFVTGFGILTVVGALLWIDRFGLGEAEVGYTFGAIGVTMAVVQGLIGPLSTRVSQTVLMTAGLALMAASMTLMPVMPADAFIAAELPVIVLFAIGYALVLPTGTALVAVATDQRAQGKVLGLYQAVGSAARVVGPVIGGVAYGIGAPVPFLLGAALLAVAFSISLSLRSLQPTEAWTMTSITRRAFVGTVVGGTIALASLSVPAAAQDTERTFVLVHGSWFGGWVWDDLAERLRAAGHGVTAPTLPGLGDRADDVGPIDLTSHIDDMVSHIEENDLTDVELVGWSYGGMVVTGVAARIPERMAQLTYLDAFVPQAGQSVADIFGPLGEELYGANRDGDLPIDPLAMQRLGVLDQALIDLVTPRLTPQPWRTYFEPATVSDVPLRVPIRYVLFR